MEFIKNFLRNFILTKKIYARISEKRYINDLRKTLQKNGGKTIKAIQKILEQTDVFFFFDMGTLLGIVREGKLLNHDMDIDVAVFAESEEQKMKLKETLLSKGCKLRFSYSIDEIGAVEDSFKFNDIKFDINYFSRENDSDICYLMYTNPDLEDDGTIPLNVVKLTSPHISELKKVDFMGTMINIPKDPEKYLAVRYGENWHIPDKSYIYWKGPSTSPTDYIGKRTIYE